MQGWNLMRMAAAVSTASNAAMNLASRSTEPRAERAVRRPAVRWVGQPSVQGRQPSPPVSPTCRDFIASARPRFGCLRDGQRWARHRGGDARRAEGRDSGASRSRETVSRAPRQPLRPSTVLYPAPDTKAGGRMIRCRPFPAMSPTSSPARLGRRQAERHRRSDGIWMPCWRRTAAT
jgi:hypothetical protein